MKTASSLKREEHQSESDLVTKNIFLYISMLSLLACGRPEFGKAATDDRVSNEETAQAGGLDEKNGQVGNNDIVVVGGDGDPVTAPQPTPSIYPYFSTNDNFVYAPKSVAQILDALSLLASGATRDGLAGFRYAGLSAFSVSNFSSLWIDDSIQIDPALVDSLSDINLDVRQISLSSPDTRIHINNVAREETDGYLSELFPALEPIGGDFLLTTGSHYTVAFKNGFDAQNTYKNTFFGATTTDREFMVQTAMHKIVDNDELTALAIEMEYNRLLVLMMPKGPFEDLEGLISDDFILRLIEEMESEKVEVHIPKMDFVNTYTISEFAELIDIDNATFSNLSEGAELGAIIHQARFILDEAGVSYEEILDFDDPSSAEELRFDRPFVFSIYDPTSQEIELLGRLTK